jgi:hypothetical protein
LQSPKQVRYIGIMKRVCVLLAGLFILLVMLACSTTRGTLLEDTAERDREDTARRSGTESPADDNGDGSFFGALVSEQEDAGLRIRSTPSGAHVYLDNRYMGITPLRIDDIDPGRYTITVKKYGYYSESIWIIYSGDYESFYFDLEEITGFLKIETFPPDAEISYESQWVPADRLHELGVGRRTIRVRAFGYEEASIPVEIYKRAVTELSVTLKEAAFGISGLQSNRTVFNPRNAGLLGLTRIRFRVSNYGRGRAVIRDPGGRIVLSQDLGRFDTWNQSFQWDGRAADGTPLPDGSYTVRIEGAGEQAGEKDSAELGVLIDSSIVLRFRTLWSGSAGLLYAPTADILPGGSVQVSSLVLAHASGSGSGSIVRAPVNLGMRFGIGPLNRFELDTSVGGIIGYEDETFFLPWFASSAFKVSLLRPSRTIDLSSAAQVKFTYQNTHTDTLANFTGLSVGMPGGVHLGPLSLVFSPEVILSWEAVSSDPPAPAAYGWIYGRFGMLLDLPTLSVGTSISLRSLRFDRGLGLDVPFQTALEAHWLIPNTQLFLSASVAGEFTAADDFFLFGGVGLGILN